MDAIDFSFRKALRLIFHLSSTLNSQMENLSEKFHESTDISYREISIPFCGGQTRSIYFYSPSQMVHKYTYSSYRHAWYDWKVSHGGKFRGYRISHILTSSCERFITDKDLLTARKAIFSDVKEPVFRLSAAQMRFSRRVINTARHLQRRKKSPSVSSSHRSSGFPRCTSYHVTPDCECTFL